MYKQLRNKMTTENMFIKQSNFYTQKKKCSIFIGTKTKTEVHRESCNQEKTLKNNGK